MKLNKIELINFRGISDMEIEFDKRATVIYGINGMGKSAVLEAGNILFSKILSEAAMDSHIGSCVITKKDVKAGETKTEIRAHISDGNESYTYYRKRVDSQNKHKGELLELVVQRIRENYIGEVVSEEEDEEDKAGIGKRGVLCLNENALPIYVYYGVNRNTESRSAVRKKYTGSAGKLDAWRDNIFEGKADFTLFFEWFRSRQEYENSVKIEDGTFVDKQSEAARAAILKALGQNFSNLRIKVTEDEAELVLVKNGCELCVKQLSDGEKNVMAMVGDIARRLSIANASAENILEGEGIVLIDEIDLHLHPSWQAVILPVLLNTFPNLQFIVTTHSSKVLGETGDDVKIIKLEMQDEDKVEAHEIPSLKGWDVNTILEKYMGTSSINLGTKDKIDHMFELIQEEKYDEAEQIANEIEQITDSENLSVVRARVLIARGR